MLSPSYDDEETFLPRRPLPHRSSIWSVKIPLRRRLIITACSLIAISILGLSFGFLPSAVIAGGSTDATVTEDLAHLSPANSSQFDPLNLASNLLGPPTAHFRDNLRLDRKYITTWISAGWTNDVMTYINLIYLALITDRIPVIPVFIPSHLGAIPPIDFGIVFDVPGLQKALGKPVLEWHQVKVRNSSSIDELGCWNTWEAVQDNDAFPRRSWVTDLLKLDISYTKAPTWIKVIPHLKHDLHSSFWSLAALAFPETRAANLVTPLESPNHHVLLPPDEHMVCYDYMYYVCANQPFEFENDYSPAWRFVGQYMHWTPEIKQHADEYVRKAIGVEEGQPTPLWIAIHIRHGDFRAWCGEDTTGCFASIPIIARRVDEVKEELWRRKGISVNHVIMTSDERNTSWWEDVKAQGWYGVDHSQTTERLGPWYPVLIDAAIQSLGVGFVGTDKSTMSVLARRRVESWANGVTRIVKWGKPDSDDH